MSYKCIYRCLTLTISAKKSEMHNQVAIVMSYLQCYQTYSSDFDVFLMTDMLLFLTTSEDNHCYNPIVVFYFDSLFFTTV